MSWACISLWEMQAVPLAEEASMGSQNYVGIAELCGQCLSNIDVSRQEFGDVMWAFMCCRRSDGAPTVIAQERLTRFYEAVKKGDRAAADKVLREWGIR